MTVTDRLRSLDAATRTAKARKAAAVRAARIRACDPEDFASHQSGFDPDGAPTFAPCNDRCTALHVAFG